MWLSTPLRLCWENRDLVRQLEDKGWQLGVADRLSRGTLQGGRAMLNTYLHSPAYREARSARPRWKPLGTGLGLEMDTVALLARE